MPLTLRVEDEAEEGGVRQAAADALGRLGPEAAPVLARLLRIVKEPLAAFHVGEALAHLGPTVGSPWLARLSKDRAPLVRARVVQAVEVAPADPALATLLTGLAGDPVPEVSAAAVGVLARRDPVAFAAAWDKATAPQALRAAVASVTSAQVDLHLTRLARAIEHQDGDVRSAAVEALAPRTTDAVPRAVLHGALDDPWLELGGRALLLLSRDGLEPDRLFPEIAAGLGAQDKELRQAALDALPFYGPAGAPLVPRLVALAQPGGPPSVRVAGLRDLGHVGSAARGALPLLLQACAEPGDVGLAALSAAPRVAPDVPEPRRLLLAALVDESKGRSRALLVMALKTLVFQPEERPQLLTALLACLDAGGDTAKAAAERLRAEPALHEAALPALPLRRDRHGGLGPRLGPGHGRSGPARPARPPRAGPWRGPRRRAAPRCWPARSAGARGSRPGSRRSGSRGRAAAPRGARPDGVPLALDAWLGSRDQDARGSAQQLLRRHREAAVRAATTALVTATGQERRR